MKYMHLLLLSILLSITLPLCAQQLSGDSLKMDDPTRMVTRSTLYGVGYANVFDTYLSPQEYRGIDFRILRESTRMTRMMEGKVSRQTLFQANMSYTHNRVDNNNTLSSLVNWSYALHMHFPLSPQLTLLAGAMADFNGGFVYNLRNGNNPAQARAYFNLGASGMAVWKTQIGRTPVTLRYQANLPLAGLQFMPAYGQSYYEIFSLGHWGGIIRFTSLHNQPSVRQLLSTDLPLGKVTLRMAYLCDLQQGKLNGIKWHAYSHAFMVGVVKQLYIIK